MPFRVPVVGRQDMAIRLLDEEVAGKLQWSSKLGVPFDNGYFAVSLGDSAANPIEPTVFSQTLWVEMKRGGVVFASRQPVRSVPSAVRSASAESVDIATTATTATNLSGGTVDATELMVNGDLEVDASGHLVGTDWLGGAENHRRVTVAPSALHV